MCQSRRGKKRFSSEAAGRRLTRSNVRDALEERDAVVALIGGDRRRALRRRDGRGVRCGTGGRQRDVVGVGVQRPANLAEAVIGEEEEERP